MYAGRIRWVIVLSIVGALGVSACSTDSPTPATAPTTTATTTTTVIETSTTTTTSDAPATTTTVAPTTTIDREAEIEAIFQDLEQRRLTALYEGDEEAFKALFANEAYLERDFESFDLVVFKNEPEAATLRLVEVTFDSGRCIAAVVETQYSDILAGADATTSEFVIELAGGKWGYSFIGEGWRCEGPHPLES